MLLSLVCCSWCLPAFHDIACTSLYSGLSQICRSPAGVPNDCHNYTSDSTAAPILSLLAIANWQPAKILLEHHQSDSPMHTPQLQRLIELLISALVL